MFSCNVHKFEKLGPRLVQGTLLIVMSHIAFVSSVLVLARSSTPRALPCVFAVHMLLHKTRLKARMESRGGKSQIPYMFLAPSRFFEMSTLAHTSTYEGCVVVFSFAPCLIRETPANTKVCCGLGNK